MTNSRDLAHQEKVRRLSAFRRELNELLVKHGAILGVTMEGDTYGVYDSYVDVSLKPIPDGNLPFCTDAVRLFEEK